MRTTMEERMAKIEKNTANLKAAYEKFATAPRYVKDHRYLPECIELKFNSDDAIEGVNVELNWHGEILVKVTCWAALPAKTRQAIESKRFENAEDALDYALETVNKINTFFNQF